MSESSLRGSKMTAAWQEDWRGGQQLQTVMLSRGGMDKRSRKVGKREQCDPGCEGVSSVSRAKLFLNKKGIVGMEMQMQEIQLQPAPGEDKTVARVIH